METFPVRDELRVLLRGGSAEPGWATDTTLVEDADRAHLLSTLDLALEEVIADQPAEIARPIVLRRLAQRHERAAYEDTLARVVEALDDAGIRFLLLKGLANESRWYRPGERRMSDIDVVVHRDDLGRLPEVAARLSPDTATVEPGISALLVGAVPAIDLVCGQFSVDVHSTVFKATVPARNDAAAWERTVSIDVANTEVLALDPELALVHATLHALVDRFCFLNGPADIARILHRTDLDWPYIGQLLEAEGWSEPVAFGIWRVADLASVSGDRIGLPRPTRRRLHRFLWPAELVGGGRDSWHESNARSKLLPFVYRRRKSDALRSVIRSVAPRDEYLRYRYGDLGGTRPTRLARWHLRWLRENRPGRY